MHLLKFDTERRHKETAIILKIFSLKVRQLLAAVFLLVSLAHPGASFSQANNQSENNGLDWIEDALELASYIEKKQLVVTETNKRLYQNQIDNSQGKAKLNLIYFQVLEATIYGYNDIMEVAKPAYIAEIERQKSRDHEHLLKVLNIFQKFYYENETAEVTLEGLRSIHTNSTISKSTRSRALIIQGYIYGFLKQPELTLATLHDVEQLSKEILDDQYFKTEFLEFEAFTNMIVGDYPEMVRLFRQKLELSDELNLLITGDSFSYHLARVIMDKGETSAAYQIDAINQRIAALTKNKMSIFNARFLCGRNFIKLDKNTRALECLEKANAEREGSNHFNLQLDFYLAIAHARAGNTKLSKHYFSAAKNNEKFQENPHIQGELLLAEAEFEHLDGNYAEAFKLQRQYYSGALSRKSDDVTDVVQTMREYSEARHTAQLEQSRLTEQNFQLKEEAFADQKTLSKIGLLIAISACLIAVAQIVQSRKLKKSRLEAEQASRAKSEFLANMSHEIRTPMNGVLGITQVLLESGLTKKQTEFANIIYKSGESLMVILNDILDFSKIEAGKLELFPTTFDLKEAVEDIAILVNTTAREKSIEVISRYSPNLPKMVSGDEGRIKQILTNLMSNAVKFTAEGHIKIVVTGEVIDEKVHLKITVSDTGIGISSEHRDKIFDGFTQAEGSTTRRFGGTGLGLTISRQLIEIMDGEIGFESQLGKGSQFWINLELPVSGSQEKDIPILNGEKVLILDDLNESLDMLREYIEAQGGEVYATTDPTDALRALKESKTKNQAFQIAIVDYKMPKVNGVAFAKTVFENKNLGNPKTILLSTEDINGYKSRLSQIGIIDICSKPLKTGLLRLAMMNCFTNDSSDQTLLESKKTTSPIPQTLNEDGDEKEKILIADDNSMSRLVLNNMLNMELYDIHEAENGLQVLGMAKKHKYDVIFMDISMPILDGIDTTKIIRKTSDNLNHTTPIIAFTAHAIKGDRGKFLAAGMNDYIRKPIKKSRC